MHILKYLDKIFFFGNYVHKLIYASNCLHCLKRESFSFHHSPSPFYVKTSSLSYKSFWTPISQKIKNKRWIYKNLLYYSLCSKIISFLTREVVVTCMRFFRKKTILDNQGWHSNNKGGVSMLIIEHGTL